MNADAIRPSRRRAARRWACVAVLTAAVATAACTDGQRRALGEEDVRTSLAGHVAAAVASAGLALDGDLDCTADIGVDGAVTARCAGTTADGMAVTGEYTGTADVDAERCTADLATSIAGEPPADRSGVACFAVG